MHKVSGNAEPLMNTGDYESVSDKVWSVKFSISFVNNEVPIERKPSRCAFVQADHGGGALKSFYRKNGGDMGHFR